MGKFVVIERHPSNEFFYQFANARVYETPEGFRAALRECLAGTPAPLTEAESRALSWAGGTERFLACVDDAMASARPPRLADGLATLAHGGLAGTKGYLGDAIKKFIFESGPISRQRWLHAERRYRRSTSVTEVVDKSVKVSPPIGHDYWEKRYAEGSTKHSWTAVFSKTAHQKST